METWSVHDRSPPCICLCSRSSRMSPCSFSLCEKWNFRENSTSCAFDKVLKCLATVSSGARANKGKQWKREYLIEECRKGCTAWKGFSEYLWVKIEIVFCYLKVKLNFVCKLVIFHLEYGYYIYIHILFNFLRWFSTYARPCSDWVPPWQAPVSLREVW